MPCSNRESWPRESRAAIRLYRKRRTYLPGAPPHRMVTSCRLCSRSWLSVYAETVACFLSVFIRIQIFVGNVVLRHLVSVNFLHIRFVGFLDTGHHPGLERIPLFEQFIDTL